MSFSNNVAFYDPVTMHKLKEFQAPTQINSAHLHPHQKYFVCGGHDFKIYKCDYETGKEVDSYKGKFKNVILTPQASHVSKKLAKIRSSKIRWSYFKKNIVKLVVVGGPEVLKWNLKLMLP